MERLHLHTIHQLQLELADVRERNGSYTDESQMSQTKSKDLSQFGQTNGKQVDSNGSCATNANTGIISNGASDNVQTFVSPGNAPNPVKLLAFLMCRLDCVINIVFIAIYVIGARLFSCSNLFHYQNMIQLSWFLLMTPTLPLSTFYQMSGF